MSQWESIIRFIAAEDGKIHYGQPTTAGDIGLLYHSHHPINVQLLSSSPLIPGAHLISKHLTVSKLLSPLSQDEIRTVRGLGMQYTPKVGITKVKPPATMLFFKPAKSVVGPGDHIVLPEYTRGMDNDYEVELCVVLAKDVKDLNLENALDGILGYCVANDVSSRKLCAMGGQWGMGKGYDTWCPIGPSLIHPSMISNPQGLVITTTVNGILKQSSNTSEMIQTIRECMVALSQGTTLEAGSIILSGSCFPLNRKTDKDPFLKHGDDVRCYVEKIGTLINSIVEENGPSKLSAKL